MKQIQKIVFYTLFIVSLASCKKAFLDEVPLDFASTNNSYVTLSDFNSSIYNLYNRTRTEFYTQDQNSPFDYVYGLDLVYDGQPGASRGFGDYSVTANPNNGYLTGHWANLYKIIAECNTILGRLDESKVNETDKPRIKAQALFFRGFAYRTLGILYGGVPLVITEVKTPKTDFVRATRKEVYTQAISDLVFAAANLPSITVAKDGELSNIAAQHLLSEVYLADGQFNNAITAATTVINDPNMSLMKTRFGSQSTEPGDVYFDLFRPRNQNRSSGNKEAIWVIQFENDVPGGSSSVTSQAGGYLAERNFAPLIRDFALVNGRKPFRWPISDHTGGRGVGFGVSLRYYTNTIWESDFNNDMRNSSFNFVRTYTFNDPAQTQYFGQTISTDNPPTGVTIPNLTLFAYQTKITTPGKHPDALFLNKATLTLTNTAGVTYTDQYMFRLAETYLIRAEAYLGVSNLASAAADINVVRTRANASPVLPSNVTINYILDERMRELGIEEKRRLTLGRLGLIYARTVNVNLQTKNIQLFNNLWPIPQSEIERNKDAKLEQNPGYN